MMGFAGSKHRFNFRGHYPIDCGNPLLGIFIRQMQLFAGFTRPFLVEILLVNESALP